MRKLLIGLAAVLMLSVSAQAVEVTTIGGSGYMRGMHGVYHGKNMIATYFGVKLMSVTPEVSIFAMGSGTSIGDGPDGFGGGFLLRDQLSPKFALSLMGDAVDKLAQNPDGTPSTAARFNVIASYHVGHVYSLNVGGGGMLVGNDDPDWFAHATLGYNLAFTIGKAGN